MIHRTRVRTPQDTHDKNHLPVLMVDASTKKTRPRYNRAFPLSLLTLVVLLRIIDFQAILEHPDPILDRVDTSSKLIHNNKTLILMIETRIPPKTVCINKDYATRNNYDFELVTHHWCFDKYHNRFGKLVYLWCRPLIFKDFLQKYKAIFYIDSDAYFSNPSVSIDSFFDYAKKNNYYLTNHQRDTTFVGAQDCGSYLTNGGIQFWRKTRYTDRMLTTWFLLYRRQFIYYWLRIHWLPNYEIHYFMNREQGSYKVRVRTMTYRTCCFMYNLPYTTRFLTMLICRWLLMKTIGSNKKPALFVMEKKHGTLLIPTKNASPRQSGRAPFF